MAGTYKKFFQEFSWWYYVFDRNSANFRICIPGNGGEIQWCFSQVKGTIEEDITEGKDNIMHCTYFNVR